MKLEYTPQRVWVVVSPKGKAVPWSAHTSKMMARDTFMGYNSQELVEGSWEDRSWKDYEARGYSLWRASIKLEEFGIKTSRIPKMA